jgi:hypothetical protein
MRKAIALLLLLGCSSPAVPTPLEQLRSDDPERARAAAETLVAQGRKVIPALRGALTDPDLRLRRRVRAVLARLTGQWGSDGTGIFWHRSFEEAVAEAKRLDKPILCLNLFGNFDEEFC